MTDEREGLDSASIMDRRNYCPGSKEAEKGLPELPTTTATDDGIAVHEAMESGETEDLNMTQAEIKKALDDMEQREVDNWRAVCNIAAPLGIMREKRFWIRDGNTAEIYATARPDVVFVAEAKPGQVHAFVCNYKTGFKRTTPSHMSWQSKTEVLSVYHWMIDQGMTALSIRGSFLAHRLSSHFDCTDYLPGDLKMVERELQHILWRNDQADAPRVPGDWCGYCKAKGLCKENAVATLYAHHGVDVQSFVPKKVDQLAIVNRVGIMSPQEMGFVYRRKAAVASVFDALQARLLALPKDELAQAGYELADGNKLVTVLDGALAFSRLKAVLSDAERAQCMKIDRTQAAVFLASRTGIKLEDAKKEIVKVLGDAATQREGAKKLKPLKAQITL